jgi:hypothetical protein
MRHEGEEEEEAADNSLENGRNRKAVECAVSKNFLGFLEGEAQIIY